MDRNSQRGIIPVKTRELEIVQDKAGDIAAKLHQSNAGNIMDALGQQNVMSDVILSLSKIGQATFEAGTTTINLGAINTNIVSLYLSANALDNDIRDCQDFDKKVELIRLKKDLLLAIEKHVECSELLRATRKDQVEEEHKTKCPPGVHISIETTSPEKQVTAIKTKNGS